MPALGFPDVGLRRPLVSPGRLLMSLAWAGLILVGVVVAAVLVDPRMLGGETGLAPGEALAALLHLDRGDDVARAIVWQARVPRILVAALVGAALAGAGSLLQLMLRNPLADPFVLGVSSGAALGSVLGLALGISLGGGAHPAAATFGAAAAALVVYRLGRVGGRLSAERVVLAGVVLSYLFAAGVMWLITLSSATEGQRWMFWLMGSVASVSSADAVMLGALVAVAALLVAPALPALDLLLISDEHAAASGVRVERVKARTFVAAALLTGAAVATCGSIGFVGLVVPHSVRLLGARDARLAVPLSGLAGASFLVVVDLISRIFGEVPIGVVTASLGAPFFLVLLLRGTRT